jgi:nitrogen fixation NifU-like protein
MTQPGQPETDGRVEENWGRRRQAQVDRDMEEACSPRVLALWKDPKNAGSLTHADGYGEVTGPCGDTMQTWLRVAKDVVVDATFWTDGCGTSAVCGSMVTIMAKGKTLEQAVRIDQQSILDELGGLPEEDRHCALLAANTLREAMGCIKSESIGKVKNNANV